METSNGDSALPNSLQLPEVLDLTAAAPLAEALLERRGKDLAIDASQVQRLGAQCLQVLLSAIKTWNAEGGQLTIVSASPRFNEDLQLLGIDLPTLLNEGIAQ